MPSSTESVPRNSPLSRSSIDTLIAAVKELCDVQIPSEVTTVVVGAARRMTRADGAAFVLREGRQCHYVDEDTVEPLWKGRRFPIDQSITGWAMRHRQPAIVPDVLSDHRIPRDLYGGTFVRSLAAVPIRQLEPKGALVVYWRKPNGPSPVIVRWLQSLADATSMALERLQSRSELREARADPARRSSLCEPRSTSIHAPSGPVRLCYLTSRLELMGKWVSIEEFLADRFGLDVVPVVSPTAQSRLEEDVAPKLATGRKAAWKV